MKTLLERVAFVLGTTITCLGIIASANPRPIEMLEEAMKLQHQVVTLKTEANELPGSGVCMDHETMQAQGLRVVETIVKPFAPKTFGFCEENESAIACTPDQYTLAFSDNPELAEILPGVADLASVQDDGANELAPFLIALNLVVSDQRQS